MSKRMLIGIMVALLTTSMTLTLEAQTVKAGPRTWTVNDDGPADFHTIQEAVIAANSGDLVYVFSGIYYAHESNYVNIDKGVALVGENPNTTILQGWIWVHDTENVLISRFTIAAFAEDTVGALAISRSANVYIVDNFLTGWGVHSSANDCGNVWLEYSERCTLVHNIWVPYFVGDEGGNGIMLVAAKNNRIVANTIIHATDGRVLIDNNGGYNNTFYHNNFFGEPLVRVNGVHPPSPIDIWDNGYPSGGNYWSSYDGVDMFKGPYQNETGSDGIGDTSYILDRYPLMYLWVIHPRDAIEDLIKDVKDMNVQKGIENSLDAKLNAVLQSLEALNAEKRNDATAKLQAFINEVKAQTGNKLTNEQADYLISEAQRIIKSIEEYVP